MVCRNLVSHVWGEKLTSLVTKQLNALYTWASRLWKLQLTTSDCTVTSNFQLWWPLVGVCRAFLWHMVTFSPAQTFKSDCKTSVIPAWGIWLILQNGLALVCLFVFAFSASESISFHSISPLGLLERLCRCQNTKHLVCKTVSHREARSNPEVTRVTRHSWQQMRPGTGPRSPRLCCLSHPLCSQGGLLFYRCLWNICMYKRTNHKPVVVFCFSFLSETLFWDQGRETERFVKQHPTRNINLLRK